jgi:hypothetical protein
MIRMNDVIFSFCKSTSTIKNISNDRIIEYNIERDVGEALF